MISNTIRSSVTSTVTYTNSITNSVCHTDRFSCTLSSNSCVTSMPLHCYRSHGDIQVSLSAINQLGSGPTTTVTIGMGSYLILSIHACMMLYMHDVD